MAGEPDGCGPKLTCLATWAKERLPSKPPVFSGGGASSPAWGEAKVSALATCGWPAAPDDLLPLALQPVKPAGKIQRAAAIRKRSLEKGVIERAAAGVASGRSRR